MKMKNIFYYLYDYKTEINKIFFIIYTHLVNMWVEILAIDDDSSKIRLNLSWIDYGSFSLRKSGDTISINIIIYI